jgi:hypothetical protein
MSNDLLIEIETFNVFAVSPIKTHARVMDLPQGSSSGQPAGTLTGAPRSCSQSFGRQPTLKHLGIDALDVELGDWHGAASVRELGGYEAATPLRNRRSLGFAAVTNQGRYRSNLIAARPRGSRSMSRSCSFAVR